MTADAAEIVRLAACCEQATGPDRELDGAIDRLLHVRPVDGEFDAGQCALWIVKDEWSGLLQRSDGFAIDSFCAARYTASLDAAMTLVPGSEEYPDCKTFVLDCAGMTTVHMGASVAHVWGNTGKHTAKAATPALALTAAALRARAAQHDHEVG